MNNCCKDCGGKMIGDGFTIVLHCEFADDELYFDKEPDAGPIYCNLSDELKKDYLSFDK